jgi:hypothetical protein
MKDNHSDYSMNQEQNECPQIVLDCLQPDDCLRLPCCLPLLVLLVLLVSVSPLNCVGIVISKILSISGTRFSPHSVCFNGERRLKKKIVLDCRKSVKLIENKYHPTIFFISRCGRNIFL